MNIHKICILGSGTLGSRVALQAAISGYQVSVYDIQEKALDFGFKTMKKILHQLEKGQLLKEPQEKILARIYFTTDPKKAIQDADFVNESVTEDVELKKKVWKQISEIAPEKTIFTTNTSYLLPSMFAEESGRPKKFCAFHFHDVFYSRVVDIMPNPETDPALIPILEQLGRSLNQVPVLVKKENPGYIFNTMLLALIGAAGKLLTGEVGSVEDIDRSWMVNFHMPMGPFGILDSIGLDTAWHVTKTRKDSASQAFAALLKEYLDAGKLGEKSGEGFYTYPNPAYKAADFIK
ncbi:MAG: 3-hydroxyacyl-CoA dehydrogenase [Algoriphagus sp.]|uniref:3-hydroxyacyl-CoA dehydrogenase n=1 Tax=Algoriphagus sp. TaxID=1872435 RepID=UPI001806CFF5|nr:3-hydroxyacyl-CoA dehydrogenase [Algoriphagus sp.]NVJ86083.1 3-hydroxyacyl-CoA dehydrogenase [Algoriphagus sp.]